MTKSAQSVQASSDAENTLVLLPLHNNLVGELAKFTVDPLCSPIDIPLRYRVEESALTLTLTWVGVQPGSSVSPLGIITR